MKISLNITRKTILAILAVSMIGTAAAAITLFTHTFPAVTTVAAIISSTCTTLTAAPSTVLVGTSGQIIFSCGMNAAFSVGPNTGSATPTFTLPSGYTSLSIPAHPAANCGGGLILATGTPVSFGLANALFDYCASFTSAPAGNFATFTVTWSQ